jgi:hypothetical protein
VCGRLNQLVRVLQREMGRQQTDRGQMEAAFSQRREQSRELPCCPRRLDTLAGNEATYDGDRFEMNDSS